MGFKDTFLDWADIAKDIIALPFKVAGATTELTQDIGEMIAQDVKNKISGEPDKEIRTSYDVKEKAEKTVQESSGQFFAALGEYNNQWESTLSQAEEVRSVRAEVYALLGQTIRSKKLEELPDTSASSVDPPALPSIDALKFNLGTFTGSATMRRNAAEEYLAQAEEYRVEVKAKITEINQMKQLVIRLKHAQGEELEMLSAIREAYSRQSEATLIQSADLLRAIASLCVEEVCEQTDAQYDQLLAKLRILWN